jgi:hypothetical protein
LSLCSAYVENTGDSAVEVLLPSLGIVLVVTPMALRSHLIHAWNY